MKIIIPLLILISTAALGADSRPQFQSQILNQAGSSPVDPNARSWTLSTGTDSITATVASSALPPNASTLTAQTNGTQKTQIVDGAGVVISSTSNSLDVNTKVALTANTPGSVSVGVTSVGVLSANASRTGGVFTNTSAAIIYIGIGQNALTGKGITLYPGGTWYMDEYSFSTAAINAIATVAASVLDFQEFQ